ncbi:glycosyltransferase family 4 protein [Phragmitibacter flavus]|uniref:Glycosyltransferase family 4 protein n=1 Tax=Phragmitibacter flavus TaxID=2576071 RepID=A0A5R8KFI2_9BACT|nr:glycosyltransferase [Phragmitibacter flavus]TLD71053.1 glycosyltransferase family 4 protein [Phragmitibacter flavus]
MRILITNNTLDERAGTELYVRDVAFALRAMGHEPVCFSMKLGEVAAELEAGGVRVVTDLARAHGPFDVIHGHHRIETTLAAMAYPQVPVISFCHGPKIWPESPCTMPSVVQYVAVDEACRERLITEGVAEERIVRLLNFVDLSRFPPRRPLPVKPRKALVFSNNADVGGHLSVIEETCGRFEVTVEVIGRASGKVSADPGTLMAEYDVVFAKARAAIEAMAVGCAVIQCDYFGVGWLVTSEKFDALRPLNFGYQSMDQPLTVEHLSSQMAAYDAADAAVVSARIRAEASLDQFVPQLLDVYERALGVSVPAFDPWEAAADFLKEQMEQAKEAQHRLPLMEVHLEDARRKVSTLREKAAGLKTKNERLKEQLSKQQKQGRKAWWKRSFLR